MMEPWFHLTLTRARYFFANRRTKARDVSAIRALQPSSVRETFFILGAGASLNDLSEAELQAIESATSAAINMAAIAPINCDLYAMEEILSEADCDILLSALQKKSKRGLIWYQDRSKYEYPQTKRLETNYPFYRYLRASVSIKGSIANFRYAWRNYMMKKVFEEPNFAVSFALTGTVARLVLLAISLGYRRIGFSGVDLGATPYFWIESKWMRGVEIEVSRSSDYRTTSVGAIRQGGKGVVPNLYDFLTEIRLTSPEISFFTVDPKKRSNLTHYLLESTEFNDQQKL